ncbi:MAG: hypothetical protein IT436_07245 [Phycisphaerales bacterium]|nr:hypothetical protein [Phycisphaerales bacterium]
MAHLNPRLSSALREYTAMTALGIVLVICLPVLGILALMFRGALLALVGLAIAAVIAVGIWHLVSPTRPPAMPPQHRRAA